MRGGDRLAWERVRRNGIYAPLSAQYFWDDRIDEAGEAAELLYVRGLAHCAASLTDGFISDRQLVRLVGVGLDNVEDRCKALTRVGLWVPDEPHGGVTVRSWLKWNRSREEIDELASRDAARKRMARGVRPESARTAPGVQEESARSPASYTDTEPDTDTPSNRTFGPGLDGADAPARCAGRADAPPPIVAEVRAQLAASARRAKRPTKGEKS
jgi:hypothetical protein